MNLVLALSNFPVIYPVYQSIINNDYWTTVPIVFVGAMSFVSHLVENHKHGMPGIGFSESTSYILNRLDVLGSIMTGSRFAYLYYQKFGFSLTGIVQNKFLFCWALLSFLFLRISEYDKYNPKLQNKYIVTHCAWHFNIYMVMNYFLKYVIYQ